MRIDQIELSGSLSVSSSLGVNPLMVNGDYLFVSNTGNVGIGTKTPTSKLVVTGSVAVKGGLRASTLSGSFTGSIKLPTIPLGSSETNIVLVNNTGDLVYRTDLSLTGPQGPQGLTGAQGATGAQGTAGTNAGITSYTNPADNRVITSVSSTEINAEANLTFDGSILSVDTTSAIKIPVGTTEQRPSTPTIGMYRYNTTLNAVEFYFNSWYTIFSFSLSLQYIVIAGGGGGAGNVNNGQGTGGGGAGGYRSSILGENSGGGSLAESPLDATRSTNYVVTVGAGGGFGNLSTKGGNGNNSVLSTIVSTGGGGGGWEGAGNTASSGGSGGGSSRQSGPGLGTTSQGFSGGQGYDGSPYRGGGGGGASSVGISGISGGTGGSGVSSNVTGTSVIRAGGGGGGAYVAGGGSGGTGGGGSGGGGAGTSGTVNTGGGGGGGGSTNTTSGVGGSGGSGVVIVAYNSLYTVSNPGGGLTFTTVNANGLKVTIFTAGTGNIQFN